MQNPVSCYMVFHLDTGGYLTHKNTTRVHHLESRYHETSPVAMYDQIEFALDDCETDAHIVAWCEDGVVQELIFTAAQDKAGLKDRLKHWRACYGGYKIRTLALA